MTRLLAKAKTYNLPTRDVCPKCGRWVFANPVYCPGGTQVLWWQFWKTRRICEGIANEHLHYHCQYGCEARYLRVCKDLASVDDIVQRRV